ncbi:hypothetical protein ABBQ38_012666 [Trebouxia sp. C0009 RCD-2024]
MPVSDGSPTLLGLHQDLLVKVLLQLEPRDLQSVSCSCRALALTDSPLWQSLFFHKWDVPRGSHLNYKKLYFRREQLLRYLESVCSRLKPEEEPSLQTLHDGRRVVGAGRFATLCPRLVEVVLSAMSVEKTTVTLLKHQVLSLAQLVVYVVYEEAIASGQATSANLLLVTELSEALMCRLGNTAGSSAASGSDKHKLQEDSTNLAVQLLQHQEAGPTEALTGNWHFHNFSTAYFDTGKPVTPFEVIPRVTAGTMHLQVDKSGQVLGTAADMLGGMHIKGAVQKFRHGLWGTQASSARTSTPDLHRQSQTLPKEASKTKPWQLARKSAPQPSINQSSGSSGAQDECRTSLGRVSFRAHLLRIRQRPDALPQYYKVDLVYCGHITSFGMAGVWWREEDGNPSKDSVGVWAMYPAQNKSQSFSKGSTRAEIGESGQQSGWNMYEL